VNSVNGHLSTLHLPGELPGEIDRLETKSFQQPAGTPYKKVKDTERKLKDVRAATEGMNRKKLH